MDTELTDPLDRATQILNDLQRPFDPDVIKHRAIYNPRTRQNDKIIAYLDLMTVRSRLDEAAPNWSNSVTRQEIRPFGMTNNQRPRLMLTATISLTIPGVGTREHMGVQVVNAEEGGEDLWKGAISDGLKKAASLFGVGRELYEDDVPEPYAPPPHLQQEVMPPHARSDQEDYLPSPPAVQQRTLQQRVQQRPPDAPANFQPRQPQAPNNYQGQQPGGGRPSIRNPNAPASVNQISLIENLMGEQGLSWDLIGYNQFDLTMGEASTVINQLKNSGGGNLG